MTTLVESPWPATLGAIVLLVIFGAVFLRTGRVLVLVGMGVVVAALAGFIFVERIVVTDTEEVEDTVHGIALDLANNDTAAVLAAFVPTSPLRSRAQSALDDVTIHAAHVGNDLEVRINKLTNPPTATAFFTGRVHAKEKRGQTIPYENFIRKFRVKFERHNRRWLIVDYEDIDPRAKNS